MSKPLAVIAFALPCLLQAQPALEDQLEVISQKHLEVLVLAVVFNPRYHEGLQIPTRYSRMRLIEIPLRSRADVTRIGGDDLAAHTVQVLLLLDDEGRVTTHGRTIKYMMRLAEDNNILVFTDAAQPKEPVHGMLVTKNGVVDLIYDRYKPAW